MTEELLISAGYQKTKPRKYFEDEKMFQKRIVDEKGTKYFIIATGYEGLINKNEWNYEIDTQFRKGEMVVNIKLFGELPSDFENEIENLWKNGKFDYYEVG